MTPYEIWLHLRLNPKRKREYIDLLTNGGYLELVDQDNKSVCIITATGKTFVDNLKRVLEPTSSHRVLP